MSHGMPEEVIRMDDRSWGVIKSHVFDSPPHLTPPILPPSSRLAISWADVKRNPILRKRYDDEAAADKADKVAKAANGTLCVCVCVYGGGGWQIRQTSRQQYPFLYFLQQSHCPVTAVFVWNYLVAPVTLKPDTHLHTHTHDNP